MADLKKQIMRRVYFIWFMRKCINATSLKLGVALVLMWQLTLYVSIKNVVANTPLFQGDITASLTFFSSAFVNTELMTVLLGIGIMALTALIAHDVISRKKLEMPRAFAKI